MKDEPPALVWPRLLELPSDNVNVVYLASTIGYL
jgi:hypothetical protein